MVYSKKIPPSDSNLSMTLLDNGWVKIKEPQNLFITVMISIPFMIINAAILILFVPPIKIPLSEILEQLDNGGFTFVIDIKLLLYIVAFFVFLVAHELLHAVFIPDFIKSRKTFWGITPYGGFVSTTEELSKLQFFLISITPFVALSVILPLIFSFLGIYSNFVTFLAVLNALASSVDILNIFLITFQVPNKSLIILNGFETYYKVLKVRV